MQQEEAAKVNKSLLSIDYASKWNAEKLSSQSLTVVITENIETTDYLKEGDIGFKKPKVGSAFRLASRGKLISL